MAAKLSGVIKQTPKFRANWVFVFKPRVDRNKPERKPQYSITMLFKKGEDLSDLKAGVREAAIEAWGKDEKKWPSKRNMPFKDQGTQLRKRQDGEEYLPDEHVPGAILLVAKNYNAPGVTGKDLEQLDETDLYSGCYARAKVCFKAYNVDGNQGVTTYLQFVQKWADGEPLGGRMKAEDAFEPIKDDGAEEEKEDNSGLLDI